MSFPPDPRAQGMAIPAALISSAKILFPSLSDSKPLHPLVGSMYPLWEPFGFRICQISCGYVHLLRAFEYTSKRGGARLFIGNEY